MLPLERLTPPPQPLGTPHVTRSSETDSQSGADAPFCPHDVVLPIPQPAPIPQATR